MYLSRIHATHPLCLETCDIKLNQFMKRCFSTSYSIQYFSENCWPDFLLRQHYINDAKWPHVFILSTSKSKHGVDSTDHPGSTRVLGKATGALLSSSHHHHHPRATVDHFDRWHLCLEVDLLPKYLHWFWRPAELLWRGTCWSTYEETFVWSMHVYAVNWNCKYTE